MKKRFEFEFEDESRHSTISYEYDENIEESIDISIESGVPVIYGNKQAFYFLAKTFAKLALGDYEDGFHIHLNKDFDSEEIEVIRVVIDSSSK